MAIQLGRFRDGQKSFMNDKITKELVQMDMNSRTARERATRTRESFVREVYALCGVNV